MYALVDDVEAYPTFLPWCEGASVRQLSDAETEATMHLRHMGLQKSVSTRNTLQPGKSIELNFLDGPFRHLHGQWRFLSLGAAACKVELEIEFEFDSRITDRLFGSIFAGICNSLVDAFIRRAAEIYGSQASE
jgi:ribosome-associated toxin RatA of RatAB toxin-antitoxin module